MDEWYISKIPLNSRRRDARPMLGSPQVMHAAVASAFPPHADMRGERALWRFDRSGDENNIYVVSPSRPDFTHLVEQAGWPTLSPGWQTKSYAPFLSGLKEGEVCEFRLSANPVHTWKGEDGKRRRVAHVTVPQQMEWLNSRIESWGLSPMQFEEGVPTLQIFSRERLRFSRTKERKREVTISRVTYQGAVRITDPEQVRKTLTQGIGHAKAYGCGLLTLVRMPGEAAPRLAGS